MRIAVLLPHGLVSEDIRVTKEVRLLVAGGHSVQILSRGSRTDSASGEIAGARVTRLRYGRATERLGNLVLKMTRYRYHPLWNRRIKHFVRDCDAEAIHSHDLKPALIACNIARRSGLPVVADLHEDYPTMNASAERSISARLFNSIGMIDRVQGLVSRRADVLVTPSPIIPEIFAERYGISPDKMVVIPNYQDLDTLAEPEDVEPIGARPDRFTILFAGSVGTPGRGVQVAVEAMPLVLERMPEARLVIVGDGAYLPRVKALAEKQGLSSVVEFTGWVDSSRVPGYIAASDVCIITFLKEQVQYNLGNPHKLFQYMAARKPVLVSDCYEIGRHVRESGAGLVFTSGDPADFAEKLADMRPEEARRSMGEKGYEAVKARYNFESLSGRILSIYSGLEQRG